MNKRVFFHYEKLEEYQSGMWRIIRGEQNIQFAQAAATLMRDSMKFKTAMQRAIKEWPNSCLHNLTSENSNRLAWLGQAGCLLAAGAPQENNRVAQEVLDSWHQNHLNQLELF